MRLALLLVVALANVASAQPALDKPSFTATPAELLAAAKASARTGGDVVVLREEREISFDERGRYSIRYRRVFAVQTQQGADDWGQIGWTWLPAFQDKPAIRARVIDPQGRVSELDPKQINEVSAAANGTTNDRRKLDGPLPRLCVGCIVEEEITGADREPLIGGGRVGNAFVATDADSASSRFTFHAPAKSKLRVVARALPAGVRPVQDTKNGIQTWTYTLGPVKAVDSWEGYVPGDAQIVPHVIATPVQSWAAVAKAYRAVIDKQIAAGPVALPKELPRTASIETAQAIVSWVDRQVRPISITLDDTTFVPASPAETLRRGNGDAKDRATLVVAALREAKIPAELVALSTGPGVDIEPDAPALNAFDHVIVRAHVGGKDLWIDPAEELMPVGQLPSHDLDRRALAIIDNATLGATPTPQSQQSVVREVRTFELAELGFAKVTEVTTQTGVFANDYRSWIRNTAPDAVKKELAGYVGRELADAKLEQYSTSAVDDLSKPFELTVTASSSKRGQSEREQINVYLFRTDTFDRLPDLLTDTKADTTLRKFDLVVPRPHIHVIENRLVIPAGFTLPTPAPERTRELGPMKLVENQRLDGRTLVVTVTLDSGKTRMTPAEVRKVQDAMRSLGKEDAIHIVVEQSALALAKRGKVKDAIAEVQKLIQLHPKEALHYGQLANIYIQVGAGEAARRAARKGVEVEPKSADAQVMLGWILSRDTYGRWLGFDHDRAGARAAFEAARKLDPKHVGAVVELATLLERNPRGRKYEVGADLKGAAAAWRAAYELDGDVESAFGIVRTLMWAGDFVEAEKVARSLPAGDVRNPLLIVAVAAGTGGPSAAIREAAALASGSTRIAQLDSAGAVAMMLRRYDEFRALKAEAGNDVSQVPALAKLKRSPRGATIEPEDVMVDLALSRIDPSRNAVVYADKLVETETAPDQARALAGLRNQELMTAGVLEDVLRSSSAMKAEGDAKAWRVQIAATPANASIFLVGPRGALKLVGTDTAAQGVGRQVLRLLAKGDETTALRMLDWLGESQTGRQTPFAQSFTAVWGPNLPRSKPAQELAAAIAAGGTDPDRAIPILTKCLPTTTEGQLTCDWELASVYAKKKKWTELEAHSRTWATRSPKHPAPIVNRAIALAHLGRFDEATKVLEDGLAAMPDLAWLSIELAEVAAAQGDLAKAVQRLEPMAKATQPNTMTFNLVAWMKLLEGKDMPGALEMARKGVAANGNRHVLHTLASILAEQGEVLEACKTDWDSMDADALLAPEPADFYVHGRILEELGLTADAIAAYRKVPKDDALTPASYALASKHLRTLTLKK